MSEGRLVALDRMRHMIEAADAIIEYSGRGRDAFDEDSAVREAMLYQIVVMGEAAKAVVKSDPDLANELTEIEWSALAKMRDRLHINIGRSIDRSYGRQ